jgi:hypothetical protein
MLHPYYPIFHQPVLPNITTLAMCNPGYPDTERFKFLKSVSNQSRSCQEDGIKKDLRSVRHIAGASARCSLRRTVYSTKTDAAQQMLITFYQSVKSR